MNLSIKHLPVPDRPRERLLSVGPTSLTDAELVSLVFGGDLHTAASVVAACGSAGGIRRATVGELCGIPGVGPSRASQLQAALELGARSVVAEPDRFAIIRTPPQARQHLRDLERLDQEELHVLALDARHRLLVRFCVARGSMNVVHVSPRDLYRRLIREGAVATVIAHNHPTGDPLPSEEDLQLTSRLRAAGEVLGVSLLDHLVIAQDAYYSTTAGRTFRDRSPFPEAEARPVKSYPSFVSALGEVPAQLEPAQMELDDLLAPFPPDGSDEIGG